MFLLDVLQTKWIFIGIGGGLILMLGIILVYTAGWRPRPEEREEAQHPLDSLNAWLRWIRTTFPWILILTLAGVALWSLLYPIYYFIVTPNW